MRFKDDDELKAATKAWFENQADIFFSNSIGCFKEKCTKCIELKGVILKDNVKSNFQSVSKARVL